MRIKSRLAALVSILALTLALGAVTAPQATAAQSAPAAAPQQVAPVAPDGLFRSQAAGNCLDGVTRCAAIINYGGTYGLGIGVDYRYVPGTASYDRILPPRWNSTTALYGWQHTGGFYVGKGACLKFLDKYGQPFVTYIGPRYFVTQQAAVTYRLVGFRCSSA